MKKENFLIVMSLLLWLGSFGVIFYLPEATQPQQYVEGILHYVITLWIIWVPTVSGAVYFKWKAKSNLLFYILYILFVISFCTLITLTLTAPASISSSGIISWELRLLLITAAIFLLTGALQLAVYWFTQRPHRKM